MEERELTVYINNSIQRIVNDILINTFRNPKETSFLLRFKRTAKACYERRMYYENQGKHIPSFLICSITDACNLHCSGCYARANGSCNDADRQGTALDDDKWGSIFEQCSDLGISFIILAGGEPLLRKDIIKIASVNKNIIFPIFTNGTMIDDEYLCLFDRNRNLIPVLSLEGDAEYTDLRRGDGVYEKVTGKMRKLHEFNILYGISITVTKRNIEKISDYDFISLLKSQGCRIVFFIEYVPVDETSGCLALDDKDRIYLQNKQDELRQEFTSVLFLSFPGDEDKMGGCLAAGRGFFHINPYGEAEACPFAPYSDMNLSQNTVLDVLSSDLFRQIKDNHFLEAEHEGGCTLFSQKDKILRLISHDSNDTDS